MGTLSDPVSCEPAQPMIELAQHQDLKTKAAKWNLAIALCVIYVSAFQR